MKKKPSFCVAKSIATLLFTTSCLTGRLNALPKGEQVGHGSASFNRDGNQMTIRAGNNSVINYQSFNIDRGEKVQFIQPGSKSRVLNRVLDGDPTRIFGTLQANGRVYLANSAGIFFENGAVINVGGLIAGAGTLADADFIAGRDRFTNLTGEVANRGLINAVGDIGLFGSTVSNFGTLSSQKGLVTMVAGEEVLVGEKGSNIFVKAKSQAPAPGSAAAVQQQGRIRAPRAVLATGDLYSVAISQTSVITSPDITVKTGRGGTATVSGVLDASAKRPGAIGGKVKLLGGDVKLQSATVDASGPVGGGEVLVGGDLHGAGSIPTATTATVDQSSVIRADATVTGPGGKVVVWSDDTTTFGGTIFARGGAAGGAGGVVETSGKLHLGVTSTASVDATGTGALPGLWLLDPQDVDITSGGAVLPVPVGGEVISQPDGGIGIYSVDAAAIVAALQLGNNVTITTAAAGTAPNDAGNIRIQAPIVTTGSNNKDVQLLLQAHGSIEVNAPVTLVGSVGPTASNTASLSLDTLTLGDDPLNSHVITGAGNLTVTDLSLKTSASSNSTVLLTGQIKAATVSFDAGGSVILSNGGNEIGATGATAKAGGAVDIENNRTITVGSAGVDAGTQPVKIATATGDILGGAGVIKGGDVTLIASGGGIGIGTAVKTASTGNLTLTTGGEGVLGNIAVVETNSLNTNRLTLATDTGSSQAVTLTSTQITVGKDLGAEIDNLTLIASNGDIVGSSGEVKGGAVTLAASSGGIGIGTAVKTASTGTLKLTSGGVGAAGNIAVVETNALNTTRLTLETNSGSSQTVSLTSTEGTVTVDTNIGSTGDSLKLEAVNALGTVKINHRLSLGSLAVTGKTIYLKVSDTATQPSIQTSGGGQTFDGAVVLQEDILLNDSGSGKIWFKTTIDANDSGTQSLTLRTDGETQIDGAVGTQFLKSLDIGGGGAGSLAIGKTTLNSPSVRTSGNQTYNNTVVTPVGTPELAAITLEGASNSSAILPRIEFNGTLSLGGSKAVGNLLVSNASLAFGLESTYDVTINGSASNYTADRITMSGNASGRVVSINPNAQLTAHLVNDEFVPAVGTPFILIDVGSASRNGSFAQQNSIGIGTKNYVVSTSGNLTLVRARSVTVWNGSSNRNSNWGNFDNWVGRDRPEDGDSVEFRRSAVVGNSLQNTVLNYGGGGKSDLNLSSLIFVGGGFAISPFEGASLTLSGLLGIQQSAATDLTNTINLPVTLSSDTTFTVEAGNLVFGNRGSIVSSADGTAKLTVDGTTGSSVNFGASLGGNSTGTNRLGALEVKGVKATLANGITIRTTDAQSYGTEVTLAGAVTLAGSKLSLSSLNAGKNDLTLAFTNAVTVSGSVFTDVGNFVSNGGGGTILNGDFATSGDQTYANAVTLGSTTTLTGGAISFNSTVEGPFGLTVTGSGPTKFGGVVGGTDSLTSLVVNGTGPTTISGAEVTTSGDQTYSNVVTLGANTALIGNELTLNNGLDATGHDLTLTFAQQITVPGSLTNVRNFVSSGTGGTKINGDFTSGSQTYTGPVTLGANLTITAGAVAFSSTVDADSEANNRTLTVNSGGTTTFGGKVGAVQRLATLETDAPGKTEIKAGGTRTTNPDNTVTIVPGEIRTVGAQKYGDPVSLLEAAKLTGSGITFGGAVSETAPLIDLTVAGPAAINGGTVTTSGSQTYTGPVTLGATTTLTGSGITFGSTVSGTSLPSIDLTVAGPATINGTAVTTSGDQTYQGAVTLGANLTIGAGAVAFSSAVDADLEANNRTLTVNSGGTTTFGGKVGAVQRLATLETDAPGKTEIKAGETRTTNPDNTVMIVPGEIRTVGAQKYGDPVSLLGAATLTGGAISFDSTVAGPFGLTVTGSGLTKFGGVVGGTVLGPDSLTSLVVNGAGTTTLSGAAVTTSGSQTYTGPVTLGANLMIGAGAVSFVSTVDADLEANNRTLTVNSGGTTTFGGKVGAVQRLATLETDAPGRTEIKAGETRTTNPDNTVTVVSGEIQTTGVQNYGDPVSLLGAAKLTGSGITFGGAVIGTAPLIDLTVAGPAAINGGMVTTSGDQTYLGAVVVGADATLQSSGKGRISFDSKVDEDGLGAMNSLTIQTRGTTTFKDEIGASAPFRSLEVGLSPDGLFTVENEKTVLFGDVNAGENEISTGPLSGTGGVIKDFQSILFRNPVQLANKIQIGQWIGDPATSALDDGTYSTGTVQFLSNISALDKASLVIATQGDVTLAGLSTAVNVMENGKTVTKREKLLGKALGSIFVLQPKWDTTVSPPVQPLIRVGYGGAKLLATSGHQIYNGVLSVGSRITLRSDSGSITIRDQVTGAIRGVGEGNVGGIVNTGALIIAAPGAATRGETQTQDVTIGGWIGALSIPDTNKPKNIRKISQSVAGLNSLSIRAGRHIFVQDIIVNEGLTLQANLPGVSDPGAGKLYLVGDTYNGGNVSFNGLPRREFDLKATIIHLQEVVDPDILKRLPGLKPADGTHPLADLSIVARQGFATGRNQSLYVDAGSLTIDAPIITVGDVAAKKDIVIVGTSNITLLSRPATGRVIELANGFRQVDRGVSLIAGNAITSGITAVVDQPSGEGNFISRAGVTRFLQETADPFQPLGDRPIVEPPPTPPPPLPPVPPNDIPRSLNDSPPISGPAKDESEMMVGSLPPGLQDKLLQLGIYARFVTPEEAAELSSRGETIYRQPVEGKPLMTETEYKVVVNRVTLLEVLRVVGVYDGIVGEKFEQNGTINEVLNRAAQKYALKSEGTDVMNFGNWLDSAAGGDTDAGTSLEILQRLKRIYVEVEKLGLTAKEVQISKGVIALKFTPTGFAPKDFEKLIQSMKPAPLTAHALEIAANPTPMPEPAPESAPVPGLQLEMPVFDPGLGQPTLQGVQVPDATVPEASLPSSEGAAPVGGADPGQAPDPKPANPDGASMPAGPTPSGSDANPQPDKSPDAGAAVPSKQEPPMTPETPPQKPADSEQKPDGAPQGAPAGKDDAQPSAPAEPLKPAPPASPAEPVQAAKAAKAAGTPEGFDGKIRVRRPTKLRDK